MKTKRNINPISQFLRRASIASLVALSLLAGLVPVSGVGAQPIDPNRGASPGRGYCIVSMNQYVYAVIHQREAARDRDVERTAYYSWLTTEYVANWYSSGCQAAYGDIDDFYGW